jgi:5-methylcytosine-specific restriction endonuclease McrA
MVVERTGDHKMGDEAGQIMYDADEWTAHEVFNASGDDIHLAEDFIDRHIRPSAARERLWDELEVIQWRVLTTRTTYHESPPKDLTKKAIREPVWNKTKGICWYCGDEISPFKFHIDHVTPRALEGSDDITNLVPTCRRCNVAKGARPLDQLRAVLWAQCNNVPRFTQEQRKWIGEVHGIDLSGADYLFWFEQQERQS